MNRSYTTSFKDLDLDIMVTVTLHDLPVDRVLRGVNGSDRYPGLPGRPNLLLGPRGVADPRFDRWRFGLIHMREWAHMLVDWACQIEPSGATPRGIGDRLLNRPTPADSAAERVVENLLTSGLVPFSLGGSPEPLIGLLSPSARVDEIAVTASADGVLGVVALPGRCIVVAIEQLAERG